LAKVRFDWSFCFTAQGLPIILCSVVVQKLKKDGAKYLREKSRKEMFLRIKIDDKNQFISSSKHTI
jgi:hypothetical protein